MTGWMYKTLLLVRYIIRNSDKKNLIVQIKTKITLVCSCSLRKVKRFTCDYKKDLKNLKIVSRVVFKVVFKVVFESALKVVSKVVYKVVFKVQDSD